MNSKFAKSAPSLLTVSDESSPQNNFSIHPLVCKHPHPKKWIYDSLYVSNLCLKRLLKRDLSLEMVKDFENKVQNLHKKVVYFQQHDAVPNDCTAGLLEDILLEVNDRQYALISKMDADLKLRKIKIFSPTSTPKSPDLPGPSSSSRSAPKPRSLPKSERPVLSFTPN